MAAYRTLPHYERSFDQEANSINTNTCLTVQDVPIPHRCEGNVKFQALGRLDASNRHAFMYEPTLDRQSSISVDTEDLERSFPRFLELVC